MGSVGSAVGGLLGGAASGGSSVAPSVGSLYPDLSQNSATYQSLLGNNSTNATSAQNTAAPAALSTFNSAYNSPYAAAYQTGAGTAGQALTNAGNQATTAGNSYMQQAPQLSAYANQVMNQGLDPQSALYNQQLSGATNSANAQNAANGVTGPWAAGTTNQATQNFNNNWQNQQLQRSLAALSGGGTALGQAGALSTLGNQLQTTGANDIYQGAGLPYNTQQSITGDQSTDINNLINQLGGINNIDSNTMNSILQYLNQGGNYALAQSAQQNQVAGAGANSGGLLGGALGDALGGFNLNSLLGSPASSGASAATGVANNAASTLGNPSNLIQMATS